MARLVPITFLFALLCLASSGCAHRHECVDHKSHVVDQGPSLSPGPPNVPAPPVLRKLDPETRKKLEKYPISTVMEGMLVGQVLQVYREIAGGGGPSKRADILVDIDVPMTARITGSFQAKSNEEGLRLYEKLLREQAGVIISRTGPNQFVVRYEKTAKAELKK